MSRKILVVEDDPDYLSQLRLQLANAGYEVLTAENLTQGRQMFADHKPDLAVIDLMLEHLDDGFVLCYEIKRTSPQTPVILITSVAGNTGINFDASSFDERSWIKADILLDKPLRFETLHREIERLVSMAV